MKKLLILLMLLVSISGCASRYNVEAPSISVSDDLEFYSVPNISAQPLPKAPQAEMMVIDNTEYAVFDLEAMNQLLEMRRVARDNTEALQELILANEALLQERTSLVTLIQDLEQEANRLGEEWASAESQRRVVSDEKLAQTVVGLSLALTAGILYAF